MHYVHVHQARLLEELLVFKASNEDIGLSSVGYFGILYAFFLQRGFARKVCARTGRASQPRRARAAAHSARGRVCRRRRT